MDKTKEFIDKANIKHNNKYDYSKTIYIHSKTKIIIICKIHGEFHQTPSGHFVGYGCKKCGANIIKNKTKLSLDIFIERSNKIHNNKYDYSNINFYTNAHTNVAIKCSIHGIFNQTPANHLKNKGCKKCGDISGSQKNNSNTIDFIKKAIKIHNNKYDYSKVIYTKAINKVIIICNIHGEFLQMPAAHLSAQGCNKCGILNNTQKQSSSIGEFILRSNKIHNNKFNYSKVNYINCKLKVCVICKIHGEFHISPDSHVRGTGCNKCGIDSSIQKQSSNTDEFIIKANKIHGDKYDYSQVIYKRALDKIIIICKIHGKFQQAASSHLTGHGCKRCMVFGFSKVQIQWLEFLEKYYNINIQHMGNSNQEHQIKNTKWKADGYCKETNTIYEFHGDFWHGNPKCYLETDKNNVSNKTMGYLYKKTLEREQKIKDLGYNLIVMWEYDWNKINKGIAKLQQKIKKYLYKYKNKNTCYINLK